MFGVRIEWRGSTYIWLTAVWVYSACETRVAIVPHWDRSLR